MLWVPGDMMSVLSAGIVMMMWYQREMAENPNPPHADASNAGGG